MANQNKIINRVLLEGQEYEINAKYWGGYETSDVKTINGESIFGEGNIEITLPASLKYCGVTTTKIEDGSKVNPVKIGENEHIATTGCVVFYEDKEFVFNANSEWELFGAEATYKVVQDPIFTPDVSGDSTAFIDTISQDANGVITATKKNINTATIEQSGIVKLIEGDMNGKDNVDGQVPSLNHTHSQYANIDDVAKKSDIDAINTIIEENEETVSVALNDINTRITTIESYDILNEVIVVKDQFDEEISKINQTIEDNEETVSVALNDINIRITTIENNGVTNNNLTELKSKVESLEITVKNQETKITELQTNFDLVNQKYNKLVSTLNKILGVDFNGDFNSDFAKDIIL